MNKLMFKRLKRRNSTLKLLCLGVSVIQYVSDIFSLGVCGEADSGLLQDKKSECCFIWMSEPLLCVGPLLSTLVLLIASLCSSRTSQKPPKSDKRSFGKASTLLLCNAENSAWHGSWGKLFRGAQNKVFCSHKILLMVPVLSRLHVGLVGQAEHFEHYIFWSEEASLMQSVYTIVSSGQGLSLYYSHNVQTQDCFFCLERLAELELRLFHIPFHFHICTTSKLYLGQVFKGGLHYNKHVLTWRVESQICRQRCRNVTAKHSGSDSLLLQSGRLPFFCLNNQQWANLIFARIQSKINAFASSKTNWFELTILTCYARCMLRNIYVSRTVCLWFLTPSVCFCSLSESFFMVKGAALFLQQGSSHQGQKAHPNHKHAGENRQTRHVTGPLGQSHYFSSSRQRATHPDTSRCLWPRRGGWRFQTYSIL